MPQKEFFTFQGGISSFEEFDAAGNFGIRMETSVPQSDFNLRGQATFDKDGTSTFSLETRIANETAIFNGERKANGIEINFCGVGFHGTAFFEYGAFDVTTLDLAVLDESDVDELEAGEELRVLDVVDLEIYTAKVTTSSRRLSGKGVRNVSLDFGEGDVFELNIASETGEVVSGNSGGTEWQRASAEEALTHQRSLR